MTINFKVPEIKELQPRLLVMGVGGAGGNAINEMIDNNLQGGQAQMAVWGDDTQTPETDGALAGDELSFQLVDGSSLYDLNLIFNHFD